MGKFTEKGLPWASDLVYILIESTPRVEPGATTHRVQPGTASRPCLAPADVLRRWEYECRYTTGANAICVAESGLTSGFMLCAIIACSALNKRERSAREDQVTPFAGLKPLWRALLQVSVPHQRISKISPAGKPA